MPMSPRRKLAISGIYAFFNTINGKCYVGSAVNLGSRYRSHVTLLRVEKHKNEHFQSAWTKYGECAFVWTVLELVPDKTKLIECEASWIASFESVYNKAAAGSSYGVVPSEEKKAKIATSLRNKYNSNENYRKSQADMLAYISNTPEERKRRSNLMKKRWENLKYREKMLAIIKGRKVKAETRENMSAAQKKRFASARRLEKERSLVVDTLPPPQPCRLR